MNEYSKSKAKDFTCDYCGKYRKRGNCYTVAWDIGYSWSDYDSQNMCWKCEVEGKIRSFINRIKSIKVSFGKITVIYTRKYLYIISFKRLTIDRLKK